MAKVINFDQIHAHCAGIDVGAKEIFVSIDGEQAVSEPVELWSVSRHLPMIIISVVAI